jgi:hypothetical protein
MHTNDRNPARACESLIRRPSSSADERRGLWDAWALAEVESKLALHAWMRAARNLKADAFAAYRAALDREEQAAVVLAAHVAMPPSG